jgi:hypothetical protein
MRSSAAKTLAGGSSSTWNAKVTRLTRATTTTSAATRRGRFILGAKARITLVDSLTNIDLQMGFRDFDQSVSRDTTSATG